MKMHEENATEAHHAGGFALLEMLVVLAILALAATFAAPLIQPFLRSETPETISQRLVPLLSEARTRAVSSGREEVVMFDLGSRRVLYKTHKMTFSPDMTVRLITGDKTIVDEGKAVLTFLPNGSSSGMRVVMSSGGKKVELRVDWLTALVKAVDVHE